MFKFLFDVYPAWLAIFIIIISSLMALFITVLIFNLIV